MDDDGQDADPLVLQPAKLVEDRVAKLDQLTNCGSLSNHALRSGLAWLREELVDLFAGRILSSFETWYSKDSLAMISFTLISFIDPRKSWGEIQWVILKIYCLPQKKTFPWSHHQALAS